MVRKIFTFYINDVLLFKCPVPGPKGKIGNDKRFWDRSSYIWIYDSVNFNTEKTERAFHSMYVSLLDWAMGYSTT